MKIIYRHTTGQNTASLMLVVWLLVLASGLANACLLEVPDHWVNQSSFEGNYIPAHAAAPAHGSEQSSKAPCLKACNESSQALQSINGMNSIDPGSPPWVRVIWTGSASLMTRRWGRFDAQLSLSDPPERIIYSRWAL